MAGPKSFDTAVRQVKRGEFAPVYYLTGDEDILKEELAALIVEAAVEPAARDFNLDVRAAQELDGESFHALVETPPMLAARRVVVVKNLEQWRKGAKVWEVVERYVAQPSPTTVLVLTHGAGEKPYRALAAAGAHVDVAALSPERLLRWVHWRAERAGCALSDDATRHLVQAVGADLAALTMEIEKLAAAAGGRAPTAEEVAQLVGVRPGETPRDWLAAALEGNGRRAVAMLDIVLAASGVTAVRLLADLGTALVGVRLARALLDRGSPTARVEQAVFRHIREARPLGLGGWREEAAAWTRWASRWTATELDRAIRAAHAADRALKGTTIADDRGVLAGMLLALGARRQAA